ncbi:unnamed protein product [Pleuronectes platessa]|uniref:Uncharacterized protein n=1 Tax=Pleuronectes platessa TaxID=8262 RepID=A0A9N7YZF8_PLEPL|nr:unnamed protein product [Pleuronectes platessa]
MGLEERVHGKVVGASRCGPASDLRHWEPEPGHPATENIIGWGGGGSESADCPCLPSGKRLQPQSLGSTSTNPDPVAMSTKHPDNIEQSRGGQETTSPMTTRSGERGGSHQSAHPRNVQ